MENVIFPFKLEANGEKVLETLIQEKLNELLDAVAVSVNTKPMSPQELQEYFGVAQPTIDKWVRLGMPKHKEGATVRYYKDEVDSWFKSLSGE